MKKLLATLALIYLTTSLSMVLSAAPALAQTPLVPTAKALASPAQVAREIKRLRHKTLFLVFDVTESTRHGGVFAQERAAAATLLRQGLNPGDRVILLPFGTGYRTIVDTTIVSTAEAPSLIDALPAAPEPGHGTNIRWPHHEALKRIEAEQLCPAVVVLLTDSFNDRPDLTDPNYPKYLQYYTLKGLTEYPDTPENRDYERLLRELTAKGCLHQYGVGVTLASDGRPVERLPVGPGSGDAEADGTQTPTLLAPSGPKRSGSLLPLLLALLLALLLLGLLLWLWLRRRPVPLRLRLGEKSLPRDFRLRPGERIALGGAPGTAAGAVDIFPLAGLASPGAFVRADRGLAALVPAPPPAEGEVAPTLFHNGLAVQGPVPLRVGDELRVSVPAAGMEPEREHRLRVEDPHGPLF